MTSMLTDEQLDQMVARATAVKVASGDPLTPGAMNRELRRKVQVRQYRDLETEIVEYYSDAIQKQLADALGEKKKDPTPNSILFLASNERVDRMGDIIRVKGWQLDEYKKNPVFLRQHAAHEEPVGRGVEVFKTRDPALMIRVQFPTEDVDPAGARIHKLYTSRFLQAVSVGFQPRETMVIQDEDERAALGLGKYGVVYTSQDLLELSAVSIPANPDARQIASFMGMVDAGAWTSDDCDALEAEGHLCEALKTAWSEARPLFAVPSEIRSQAGDAPEGAAEGAPCAPSPSTAATSGGEGGDEHGAPRGPETGVLDDVRQVLDEVRALRDEIKDALGGRHPGAGVTDPDRGSRPEAREQTGDSATRTMDRPEQGNDEDLYAALMEGAEETKALFQNERSES